MAGKALYREFLLLSQTLVCLILKRTIGTLVFMPSLGCIGTVYYHVHPKFRIHHCTDRDSLDRDSFYDPQLRVSSHDMGNSKQ